MSILQFIGVLLTIIVNKLIAVSLGWVTGFVVGLVFTAPILLFFEKLGITGLSVAQLGATLAFIASFIHQEK